MGMVDGMPQSSSLTSLVEAISDFWSDAGPARRGACTSSAATGNIRLRNRNTTARTDTNLARRAMRQPSILVRNFGRRAAIALSSTSRSALLIDPITARPRNIDIDQSVHAAGLLEAGFSGLQVAKGTCSTQCARQAPVFRVKFATLFAAGRGHYCSKETTRSSDG